MKKVDDKLEIVLNHAGNGITAIALRGETPEFLFANDKYFEIMGRTREEYAEATKNDMFALVHPNDRNKVRSQVTSLKEGEESLTVEYRLIHPDGKIVWIETVVTITRIEDVDVPVQVAAFYDITADKEKNEQLAFLNDSAHDILAQPDTELAVNRTLEKVRLYFAGDRAYVIEFDYEKQVSNNTYEKCAEGVTSEIDFLKNVPFAVTDYWIEALKKNQFVVIENVKELDDSKEELRSLLLKQNIVSIIIAPLWRDGDLVGYVGIDNPRRAADQLDRLAALSDYIAVLLTRRDLSKKIEHDKHAIQQLMDDTPGGFVRMKLSSSGAFVPMYSNEGFCKMLGMSHEELKSIFGRDVLDGIHPDDRRIVKSAGGRMSVGGRSESARFRVRNGKGVYIWLRMYGRKTKDISGNVYMNVYYSDVTRLVNEEAKQAELLDNLPCGAALYRFDGKHMSVIHINKTYWKLVDREPGSSANIFDMIHPDDKEIAVQEVKTAVRQKRNISIDFRVRSGEAGYKAFHIESNIVAQEDGTYLFFVSYTPISEQEMSIQEMLPIALSTMMSASEDISYVKDKDLHYICCSESAAKLMGFDNTSDIVGKNDFALFDKKVAERFVARDVSVIETGESLIEFTEKIPTKEGRLCLASTSKYPIMDASGNVIGLYGVSRDVTAQKEKESQLELLTSSIPGGIAAYAADREGIRMVYFNDGFCEFSGCSREEYAKIVAEDPLAFVFEEDKPGLQKMIKEMRSQENGHKNGCLFRCHTKDGGYRWMSMQTSLSKLGENQFVLNVVQLDVTEQQEEKERLRMSEELNRLAIKHSGNIITRFDVAKRTLTLPDAFDPIFELPHVLNNMPEEQIALNRVSADTADVYRELFEGIVRGEKTGVCTYKQTSSKGWRWLEAQYTTVFSDAGKPASAVISFVDVTDELEKEVVYNKWQQSLDDRPENSYTLFRCNLSKGTSFDSWEGELLDIRFSDMEDTFKKRTEEFVKQFVYPEDRERYLGFVNADTMLAEYYRGHRSDTIEFRVSTDDGKFRWLRLSVDLVEYPTSNDVEAYLMFEDIDKQKQASLMVLKRSETDPLTGIFNRAAFIAHMEGILSASKAGEKHALFMLDVDNFKGVNDTMGHDAGDKVLKKLTSQINAILRHNDLLGRLGGDEFFVFLRDITNEAAAEAKAKQICAMDISPDLQDAASTTEAKTETDTDIETATGDLEFKSDPDAASTTEAKTETDSTLDAEPKVDLRFAGAPVTVSVGIAMIPEDGNDFDTLYKKVDQALYRRKEHGKNGYAFVSDKS